MADEDTNQSGKGWGVKLILISDGGNEIVSVKILRGELPTHIQGMIQRRDWTTFKPIRHEILKEVCLEIASRYM